ncbi:conserved hypothetical protein [Culex quinquefasciatus]|uniref:Uncharacterized protein n=1 Tax=Culex quinquefasciatus TaxID=7176 RepID=B0WRT4_CULQU|nr:conserved hypothetical protein [Culex quinquefasciatus]|eukprot:XP_001851418.1 conserved hypothetical protein [Culex quinquefasciatus]
MTGSDRRSINSKGGKNGKSANSETANSTVSQQLQEISAKLQKLDDLEKLNKDLYGKLLQLAHRVDVVSAENRLLKREIEDLRQDRLQEEVLIKGFKFERPNQHLEVFRGVCERAGFDTPDDVKEVRPLVFKHNKRTDAVLVKFWRVEDKGRFIRCIRSLKKPIAPRDIDIRSPNKFILVQDHLTPEKHKIHTKAWDLCKLGLQRPWIYKGSTWITHPESNKRFRVADLGDLADIEFVLVTREGTAQGSATVQSKVTVSEHECKEHL